MVHDISPDPTNARDEIDAELADFDDDGRPTHFECPRCDRRTNTRHALSVHYSTHNTDIILLEAALGPDRWAELLADLYSEYGSAHQINDHLPGYIGTTVLQDELAKHDISTPQSGGINHATQLANLSPEDIGLSSVPDAPSDADGREIR